KLSHQPVLL
nr:Chain C, Sorting nexin 24 (127-135) peptide [Homo sapiens]8TBW_F Chain F, Sorting nexin 24 (127-135) peptide [Homo sapiens]